jgi:hypothetical protein
MHSQRKKQLNDAKTACLNHHQVTAPQKTYISSDVIFLFALYGGL